MSSHVRDKMLWDLWVPRSRGGHWLMQQERAGALTWSSWGKQKNAIRDNSGDSSQASAKTCISKTLRSSDHKDPNTKSTPQVKAVSEDFICLKDRLALQAQKRRAAGPVAWPRCAEAGRSGQCEAARLRSLGPGRLRSHCGLTTDWIRMRIF